MKVNVLLSIANVVTMPICIMYMISQLDKSQTNVCSKSSLKQGD